jgi:hypothetical protein
MAEKKRWVLVIVYAAAMAWVESAAVLYLRLISGRLQPYQLNPSPLNNTALHLGPVEMVREAATMVMLITVGWLAGRSRRARLGYFIFAFGVWDIFYYVFLHVMAGWPASLIDWDVLFLLPLPWWGPVLAPMLIAMLLVIGGTLLVYFNQSGFQFAPGRTASLVCFGGVLLSLYVFMVDSLQAVAHGVDKSGISNILPLYFNWTLFIPALLFLSTPILELIWQWRKKLNKLK